MLQHTSTHESATDTSAERDQHQILCTNARTQLPLGKRCARSVVVTPHWFTQSITELFAHGHLYCRTHVWRRPDNTLPRNQTRNPNTNRVVLTQLVNHFLQHGNKQICGWSWSSHFANDYS
jgi:hypothetical protein